MEPTGYGYNLISFKLCPFVQRSVITLEEKKVPYALEYIELDNKPEWFLKLSPLGKVPVLRVQRPGGGEAVLFESAVINEFIEETAPGPGLHPQDPLARAHNRAWIEVGSDLMRRTHRLMTADSEGRAKQAATAVRTLLYRFDDELVGPLFGGESFSLVDAAVAPTLQRLTWCEEMAPALEVFCADLKGVLAWREALLARPSVQRSTVPGIRELFAEHLAAKKEPPSWVAHQS